MSLRHPTQQPGDNLKKAITLLSELQETDLSKSRSELLQKIQLKFDLTPMECEFLNRHFSDYTKNTNNG